MSADRARPLLVLLALAAACGGGGRGGGSGIPSPANLHVEPSRGYSGRDTPVVITGDNFLARTTGTALDTRHQVWVGETELVDVEWKSVRELHATVPAGLPSGKLALRVRNAYGREGILADAFTVETTAGGALAVRSVAVTPAEVNVGQTAIVTATVESVGTAAVSHVVASLPPGLSSSTGGAASVTDGPSPTAADALSPGQSTTFTWTVRATAAGQPDALGVPIPLELPVTASGEDAFSGLLVQADARAGKVVIDQPAGLTATVVVGRTSVDVGQPVPVTFSVTNGGTAAANLNTPVPAASLTAAGGGSGTASCTAVTPAGGTTVGPRGSRAFTWSCTATAAGVLRLTGTVTGTDANTGAALSATPAAPDSAAVQTAATLSAAASIQGSPAAVNVGQTLTVNLTVSNGGTAAAHVTRVTPTVSPATTSCSAATPDPPAALAGGGSVRFSWACTPAATGTLTLGATVAGADDNTGAALTATSPAASVPVQLPAALVAIPSATPTPVNVAQPVTVSLLVYNGNGAAADLTAVTPVVDGTSTATATCGAATPAPGSIPSLGHATFTWSCTPGAAGTLQLTATVTGTDHNSGAALTARPAPFPVTVQSPASVAVTALVVDRSAVDTRQDARVTISLRNSGGAGARVTIAPSATPSGPSCAPAPTAAQVLAGGGGTLSASWTCSAASAGTYAYGASITAVDANSGASASPAASPVTVTVQTPAALSAVLAVDRSTLDVDQRVAVTLTVTNQGGASASVTGVAPSATAGSGAVSCPTAPAEPLPITLRGGAATAFTWSCVAASVGAASLGAAVTATDANSGGSAGASAPAVGVTIQTAAALSATLTADRTSLGISQTVNVTLTVRNGGEGTAVLTGIAPAPSTGAVSCPQAPTEPPGNVASGATAVFHWTCAGAAAGTATLGATLAAHALNTGTALTVPVDGVGVTVLSAPALTATLSADATSIRVGGAVNLTLDVGNALGAEGASVTAIAPVASGGAVSCPAALTDGLPVAVPGGSSVTFRWSCSGAAVGTASLGAAVTAASGPPVSSTTAGVSVVAGTGVALTGTLSASPATLPAASGGTATLSLTLRNPGTVSVHLGSNAVTATVDAVNAAGFTCHNPSTEALDLAPGATAATPITWTCTSGGGPVGAATAFGARVAATDASGNDASATVTGGSVRVE